MSAKDITMTPTVLWFLSSMTHQNPDIKYQSQIPIRYHHSNTFIDTTIPQHQTMADLGNVMVVSWNRAFSRSSSMWGFPWHNHFWIISGNPNQLHPHPRSIPGPSPACIRAMKLDLSCFSSWSLTALGEARNQRKFWWEPQRNGSYAGENG